VRGVTSALSCFLETFRVLRIAREVDRRRLLSGPAPLLAELRARGRRGVVRSPEQRRALKTAIRVVDAAFPGGGNCYRRALFEVALDPTAAGEPLHMALREHGGPQSGHAWLGGTPDTNDTYDAVFVA